MEKQTRMRILVLSVLLVGIVLTGSASQPAYASNCICLGPCPSCEHVCMPMDEACRSGSMGPDCQEQVNCCYQSCIWY